MGQQKWLAVGRRVYEATVSVEQRTVILKARAVVCGFNAMC